MKRACVVLLILTLFLSVGCAATQPEKVGDPIKGFNKVMLTINDKLFLWVLDPVSRAYAWVLPEYARERVDCLLDNADMPVRAINCLLQGEFKGAGVEVVRFGINITVGVLGLWDRAGPWGWKPCEEDFGQTFAVWGCQPGAYIVIPLLGPSSARDLIGRVLDIVASPLTYATGAGLVGRINYTSLHLGEYQDFKDDVLDFYIGMRNAWYQNRLYKIRNENRSGGGKSGE